jgi:multidrug transporter EmrE-like cation transporter
MSGWYKSLGFNAAALALLLAASHALLKWVSQQPHHGIADLLARHWLATGSALAIYAGVFFYYLAALRWLNMSLLYPVYTGAAVLLVVVTGCIVFGERIDARQILGAALIAAGVYAMYPRS